MKIPVLNFARKAMFSICWHLNLSFSSNTSSAIRCINHLPIWILSELSKVVCSKDSIKNRRTRNPSRGVIKEAHQTAGYLSNTCIQNYCIYYVYWQDDKNSLVIESIFLEIYLWRYSLWCWCICVTDTQFVILLSFFCVLF